MQGNSAVLEKFNKTKKDPAATKAHKADKAWRQRRQNRHESE